MRAPGLGIACAMALSVHTVRADSLVDIVRRAVLFDGFHQATTLGPGVARRMSELQRDVLQTSFGLPPKEQAVAFRPDGSVLWVIEGTVNGVSIPPDKDVDLRQSASRLIFVHNHPTGASFSPRDIAQLAKGGIEVLVAIGHDGSIYVASRGPRFDEVKIERLFDVTTRDAMRLRLRLERPARPRLQAIDDHFEHLGALALSRAGVIHYWTLFSQRREATYRSCGRLCEALTDAAVLRISQSLTK